MNTNAVLLQVFSILIQCVITLMSLFSDSWDAAITLSQLYILAQCLAFIAIILDNRRGGISYMIEFFLLFFIALPALLQVSKRVFPWFAMLQPLHLCTAFGLLAISHIALQIGYITTNREAVISPQSNSQQAISTKSSWFYTRWAWVIAILAIMFAVLAGPSNLFVARFELADAEMGGMSQQFLYMCRSLSLLAIVMILFLVKYTKNPQLKRINIYVLIGFLPFFLIINYLPALPRFVLFGIFIAVSTVFINYFSPKVKSLVAIVSVLILFVVFPTIKSLGHGELNTAGLEQRGTFGAVTDYLLRVDFDAYMQVTETVRYYADDLGPGLYGKNFLGVALFFIPRAIWPDKPRSTGIIVAERLGYIYLNVSSPLPAEALMGFGLFGPVLVFYLLASFVTRIERNAKHYKWRVPKPEAFILYAISMAFIVIVLRGALNAVAPQFATAFLAFYIVKFFVNKKLVVR